MPIPSVWLQSLANILVDSTITSISLVVFALVLGRLWVKSPAARRHLLWRVVMVGLVLAPIAATLPRIQLGWLPASSAVNWVAQPNGMVLDFHEFAMATIPVQPSQNSVGWAPFGLVLDWTGWLSLIWLLGCIFFLARFLQDIRELHLIVRASQPLGFKPGGDRLPEFIKLVRHHGQIQLFLADREITPMAWGWRKPKILLPKAASDWTEERRELVLLHEWGHILQRDFPFLVLARLLTAFFWFNPIIWLAARCLARTREQACDDLVLGTGVNPSTYADHLLDIVRASREATHWRHASLAMARLSELEGRLMAILDRHQPRGFHPGGRALHWFIMTWVFMGAILAITPWRTRVGVVPIMQDHRIAHLPLSDEDWSRLEKEGIRPSFIKNLIDFGFRDLDLEKTLYLRESGVEEQHIARQADLIFEPLKLVTDRNRVCEPMD